MEVYSMSFQEIRSSEFIYTLGPGAIIETTEGPRIILNLKQGLFKNYGFDPQENEISDSRMSSNELNGGRIFQIPVSEMGKNYLYYTRPFPSWKLCTSSHVDSKKGSFSVLYRGQTCPVCEKDSFSEPIRFVSVCPKGHLDDVNWDWIVHEGAPCRRNPYFKWFGGPASLHLVTIECGFCGKSKSLKDIYLEGSYRCSGRRPEVEELKSTRPVREKCTENARVIQRQASSVRLPVIKTFFTIPPVITELHKILESNDAILALLMVNHYDEAKFASDIRLWIKNNPRKTNGDFLKIQQYSFGDIVRAYVDLSTYSSSTTDPYKQEFDALVKGSKEGIPSIRSPETASKRGKKYIEMDPNDALDVKYTPRDGKTIEFRVVPIRHLRTVTVQKGYVRLPGDNAKEVDIGAEVSEHDRTKWYPGIEHFGEGIFITTKNTQTPVMHNEVSEYWYSAWQERDSYDASLFRSEKKYELTPEFVWWHTLSHLLIRIISIYAGYSSASIRERIYYDEGDSVTGGIIIYSTQKGADGTLGGLISLASSKEKFSSILNKAFELSYTCSNDPLCSSSKEFFGREKVFSGASCYACCMLSETSCEHRNLWLDRHLLSGDT